MKNGRATAGKKMSRPEELTREKGNNAGIKSGGRVKNAASSFYPLFSGSPFDKER